MNTKRLFVATIALFLLSNIAHAAGDPKVKSAMAKSDCFTCHSVNGQVVGPAYKEVAKRYHGTMAPPSTIAMLAEKIIKGGNGNWNKETGGSSMPAHAKLTKEQATDMVKWVLAQ
uniref:Cytochrome c-551 (Cytochrome c551) (Cytochrome C8) n=1 Tax=mine drainage metagenome TaxID=410659 RepID=E6QX79_9ZZZZ